MFRRSFVRASLSKGAQNPGPALQGWGRSAQKRRLEYETVDSKYHKREFNKNWDLAGCEQRSSDYLECRTYFNIMPRWGGWIYNNSQWALLSSIPTGGVLFVLHLLVIDYHERLIRAAWW